MCARSLRLAPWLWLLVSLGLLGAGCGAGSDTSSGSTARSSGAEEASAGPRLVRVSDEDTTVYLFGTVHLLHPSTQWMDERVARAFDASSAVYFEVPTDPQAMAPHMPLLQQLAMNPPGVTLSSLLTPEIRAHTEAVCARVGVPYAQLEPMRPWLASITLAMAMITQRGADPGAGVDRTLAARAESDGRAIRYLEEIPTQLHAIGDLPDALQVELLGQSLDEVDEQAAHFDEMVAAWQRGDTSYLEHELVDEMRTEAPELYESLLVRRNHAWVEVIAALMASEPGTFFVAAGAAHFVGPDAVQSGLAARGLRVE
ncbi:MAG: TraB/GumN family protein [Sandaracinaceae bacterium]|nr:TraB/GumN family protein [Sandaracinaceae bacterium]